MADVAAEIRRLSHHDNRDKRQRRRDGDHACRGASSTPRLPERHPANEPGELHPGEAEERDVLMQADRRLRDSRLVPELLKSRGAGHVGRKRQDRDREEHFQADQLQRLVAPDKGDDEKSQGDDPADRRHVVHAAGGDARG